MRSTVAGGHRNFIMAHTLHLLAAVWLLMGGVWSSGLAPLHEPGVEDHISDMVAVENPSQESL